MGPICRGQENGPYHLPYLYFCIKNKPLTVRQRLDKVSQTRIILEFTRRLIRFAVDRLTFMFSAQISIGTPAARYSNKALSSGVKFASCRKRFSSGTVKSYTFKMRSITPRFLLAHMAEPNICYKDLHRFHCLQAPCMA